jgi:hypothetical protein
MHQAEIGQFSAQFFAKLPSDSIHGTLTELDAPAGRSIEVLVLHRIEAMLKQYSVAISHHTDCNRSDSAL